MNNSDIKQILNKIYKYCSKSEKCEFDIKKYLEYYDISDNDKSEIINKLYSEGFINKERYIKAFVNDKHKFNKWGKIKIQNALYLKGFDNNLIKAELEKIDDNDYLETISNVLKTKAKQIKFKDEYSFRNNLIRFGLSRGFDYENIEKIIKSISRS